MLTAKLGQLNLSNKTEAQAYMFVFFSLGHCVPRIVLHLKKSGLSSPLSDMPERVSKGKLA